MKTRKNVFDKLILPVVALFVCLLSMFFTIRQLGIVGPSPDINTTKSDHFDIIDLILKKMGLGNVAFNSPKTMNLRDTAMIQLMLGLEIPTDELKQMIEAAGDKESARIRVSDRMDDRLSGPNFAITAITPEIQAVSRSDITEWKWEVKPNSYGRHYLHLTLSVLLNVDGAPTLRTIRTFDKMVEVQVAWHQRVGSFFAKNWQWLWTALLVPVVGWLWKKRRESTPDVKQSDG